MKDQLERAINLVNKTGDRLVIYNYQREDNTYVVMSIDEYEKLAINKNEVRNLTEDELLDKINRDIAIWKSEQIDLGVKASEKLDDSGFLSNIKEDEILRQAQHDEKQAQHDSSTSSEQAEEPVSVPLEQDSSETRKNNWIIPENRKEGADEIIDEDRQYLEEVSF